MDFKQRAIETYLNSVKNHMPTVTKHELEIFETVFSTGFNIGIAEDKGEVIQEMALTLLRQYPNKK